MKKMNYLVLLIISIFIFNMNTKALSIEGDGNWHTINYSDLKKDNPNLMGTISSCNALSDTIEVKKVDDACVVRSKINRASQGEANFSVSTLYSGTTKSYTYSTSVTKSSNLQSTDDVLPSAGDAKVTSGSSSSTGEDYFQLCSVSENPQLVAGLKLVGIFLTIIKVIVPIILIVMGSLDMSKAVISKDNDAIQKNLLVFLKRAIAGVLIFLAPSIILSIFHMVDGMDNFESPFSTCLKCILGSSQCPNVSFKGD